MNKPKKIFNLLYDPDIYDEILETGRIIEGGNNDIELLDDITAKKESDKLIRTLVFSSMYVFDTKALDKIMRVHRPLEANAYCDSTKNNVLTIQFYKI